MDTSAPGQGRELTSQQMEIIVTGGGHKPAIWMWKVWGNHHSIQARMHFISIFQNYIGAVTFPDTAYQSLA